MLDFIVADKSVGIGAYCIDFHEPNQTGENMHYYFLHHDWFYATAQPGDHLRVAAAAGSNIWGDGYRELVRAGRVVGRSFSDEQFWMMLLITAALLPGLVFLPSKNKVVQGLIWWVAIFAEVMVIAVFLFWALLLYAFGHGGGC